MTVAFIEIPALSLATMSPACFSWYHPTAALRKRIPMMTPKSEEEVKRSSVLSFRRARGRGRRTDPVCRWRREERQSECSDGKGGKRENRRQEGNKEGRGRVSGDEGENIP
jgi:hypothetical protein